jgi:hypothetical protein
VSNLQPPGQMPQLLSYTEAPLPKRRNIFAVWLGLPIITLGIYSLVWYYKINKETRFNPRANVSPLGSLVAATLGGILIIPPFVSVYRTGERIGDAQRVAGIQRSCSGAIGVLLAFFGFFPLYYQHEMNKIVDAYPGYAAGQLVTLRVP